MRSPFLVEVIVGTTQHGTVSALWFLVPNSPLKGTLLCSRILWNNNDTTVVVARTFDWGTQYRESLWALPRGIQRSGGAADNPARWTSRYGSLVVVENEKGIADGVNEAGLAAHLLYMEETSYPPPDLAVPGVVSTLWLQYYLDNFATVQELVSHLHDIRVEFIPFGGFNTLPLHLAFEDVSGDSAVVEFVDGSLLLHHGPQYTVMTNEPPLDEQLANLQRYQDFGGTIEGLPGGIASQDRFVRASYYLQHLPQPDGAPKAVAYVMGIAANVSAPFGAPYVSGVGDTYPTWWRTATDLTNRVYYFSSTLAPNVIWVELAKLDLSPGAAVRRLDALNPVLAGEVSGDFVAAQPGF